MENRPTDNKTKAQGRSDLFQGLSSIRKKILVIMMAVSTAALVVACIAFALIETHSFRQTMVRDLSTLTEVIAYNSTASLMFSDPVDAGVTLKTLQAKPAVKAGWLFNTDGILLAEYLKPGVSAMPTPPPPEQDLHLFTEDGLVVNRRIFVNEGYIGGIILLSGLEEMQSILRRNVLTMIGVLIGSFMLTYFLSSRLLRVISSPISELVSVARGVSQDRNYAVRAEKYREDEIGVLFDAFNSMLETVQKREIDLVEAKQEAEASAQESQDLLATMGQINLELELEVRKRKRIEDELKQHRAQLEQAVKKRTLQLTEANLRLEQEIEEKRLAEENIRKALEEKVVLLGEIHHRVKNNLQIIASLLQMSKSRARTSEASEQLGEAHAKIFTMALIHSQLYQNERFDEVNMERHVKELFSHLASLYGRKSHIAARIFISGLRLPVTQAIPCALVLNELVSNAFKYAFAGKETGSLVISMKQDGNGTIGIQVEDNGVGIPEEIDVDHTSSLGFKLVRNIVRHQLGGTFHIDRRLGTRVHIEFPVSREDAFHAQDPSRR